MQKLKKIIKDNIIFLIVLLILTFLFNYRLPYYISASGGTIDISDRIKTENQEKINGSLNMLYVTEYEATIPLYLLSYVFKDWKVEKIENVQINNENMEEIYDRNKIMLDNSIQNATYVAYTNAEKNINIKESNNYIIGTTSDNGLKIGDKIIEVNGKTVNDIQEIKEIINNCNIGDQIQMTIVRNKKKKQINTQVYEENGKKLIGIAMITNYEYILEPEVTLKFKKSESGSSGGLMMALSIYNTISGEDIVKGRNIAGTGTIDHEGNIGAIDGIKYKLKGAVKQKMDVVLVPEANYEEAIKVKKEKKYNIEIVKVKNFSDALEYLRSKKSS